MSDHLVSQAPFVANKRHPPGWDPTSGAGDGGVFCAHAEPSIALYVRVRPLVVGEEAPLYMLADDQVHAPPVWPSVVGASGCACVSPARPSGGAPFTGCVFSGRPVTPGSGRWTPVIGATRQTWSPVDGSTRPRTRGSTAFSPTAGSASHPLHLTHRGTRPAGVKRGDAPRPPPRGPRPSEACGTVL